MRTVRETLTGGTRTSVGAADEVIQSLLNDTAGLSVIYGLFLDDDPVVAMRSSYVAMKVAEQIMNWSCVTPATRYKSMHVVHSDYWLSWKLSVRVCLTSY